MQKYFVSGILVHNGICKQVPDEQAEFWTVYRQGNRGLEQLFDMCFRAEAEKVIELLEERDSLRVTLEELLAGRQEANDENT